MQAHVTSHTGQPEAPSRGAAGLLEELRTFSGKPEEFWRLCVRALTRLANAAFGVIAFRDSSSAEQWRIASIWPAPNQNNPVPKPFLDAVGSAAGRCVELGSLIEPLPAENPRQRRRVVATRLDVAGESDSDCVALFLIEGLSETTVRRTLDQLRIAAALPAVYQLRTALRTAQTSAHSFAVVMDLMVLLNAEGRFLAAAMMLCNELAARNHCERVSLGWLKGDYVRLQAMSHTERFERKAEAVKAIELAMEESLNQDEEVLFPRPDDSTFISRDHGNFAREHGVPFMCSVPLRIDGATLGVITCERSTRPFDGADVAHLRLGADQVSRRLHDLKRADRWFGARWAAALRDVLGKLVGIEHTWPKILALLVLATLCVLIFYKAEHRVEASFGIRSANVSHLPAPFDGYIKTVRVDVGDVVTAGLPLISLDTKDLELEEAAAQAEENRYLREAEKARAEGALAEMKVADALAQQARVKLELIRHRLSQSDIKAPLDGIVVRGDFADELSQRIGAPVRRGDILVKSARIRDLYVEAEVEERDIDHVTGNAAGEIAFASQPHLKFPITVERIEPTALPRDRNNVFLVRCAFATPTQDWFRPGMSGICKIDAGKRTLLWIFTHRTVEFLRMLLWW